jgi:hypothetical protein
MLAGEVYRHGLSVDVHAAHVGPADWFTPMTLAKGVIQRGSRVAGLRHCGQAGAQRGGSGPVILVGLVQIIALVVRCGPCEEFGGPERLSRFDDDDVGVLALGSRVRVRACGLDGNFLACGRGLLRGVCEVQAGVTDG